MSENTKRLCTLLLAVSMILSMLPVGAAAQTTDAPETEAPEVIEQDTSLQEEPKPLTPETTEGVVPETTLQSDGTLPALELDVPMDITIGEDGNTVGITFTPEQTGGYCFYAISDYRVDFSLYDADMNWMELSYYYGEGDDFRTYVELTADTCYTLFVGLYDSQTGAFWGPGAFQMVVKKTELESIVVTPCTAMERSNGYWHDDNNGGQYYWYNPVDLLDSSTYTATFTDGTVLTGEGGSFTYNGQFYGFQAVSDQSPENQWTVGNTYPIEVSVMGVKTQTTVTIEPSPLTSICFTPVTVVENTCGYMMDDWNPETGNYDRQYFWYWYETLLSRSTYTATFNDGTVLTGNDRGFTYNGTRYEFNFTANQSYENQWTLGNTYYINVDIMGQQAQVPVTVISLPLESLSFEPISVAAGSCGAERTENGVSYYHYDLSQLVQQSTFNASFTDGTVISQNNTGFYYGGEWYNFELESDQSPDTPWVEGNTYTINVSVKGVTAQIPVTIEASPVQSMTFTPITVVEGTRGDTQQYWEGDTQKEYYYYDLSRLLEMSQRTVTFTDGTTQGGNGNSSVYYQEQWHGPQYDALQDSANQWTAGNTYYITVTVLGKTAQVPVHVIASPVVSVTAQPVQVIENKTGSMLETWVDGSWVQYYSYYWWQRLNYTVTFADGTSTTMYSGSHPWYDGQMYYNEYRDNQSYQNQWTVGNTYTVTFSVMGYEVEVPVTIIEPPIASITFDNTLMEANVDGYWSGDYFRYNWFSDIPFTVTFKDGTVKQGSRWSDVYYDGESYALEDYTDSQSAENPWLPNNTYKEQVKFAGKWYDIHISVCVNAEDNGFTYFLQDGKAVIDSCTMQTELILIPETIDGYPVAGIISLGNALDYALEIRIPDSVAVLSQDFLVPQDEYGYCDYEAVLPLQKLTLGSGISVINATMLRCARNLEHIEVAKENPNLCSIDGVVYNKDVTTLMAYPPAKEELHIMPDTVTNANILFEQADGVEGLYANVRVQLGAGVEDYRMVDGIIYNRDMTQVLKATGEATGSYVMPESVKEIAEFAFAGTNLTAVTLSPSVTYITYGAFCGAERLEEITIPGELQEIGPMAFTGCDSLNKVDISNLYAWCETWFFDNPLSYAHDLYLNGELVKDLVIPATVPEGVYYDSFINWDAFAGGSFETVTIPSRINEIGHDAFRDCENLKKVYITDLGAWSGTLFGNAQANPLYYAHDLYLNGELVKDLVLTETVADRVYSEWISDMVYGVNNYAFYNASIETVTVPESIGSLGYNAFAGCEKLMKVNISSLQAWSDIDFESAQANPLYYAKKLYLDGEKVTDLVLPKSVTSTAYVWHDVYGVGDYTFCNIDIETLTVPDYVYVIGNKAFYGSSVEEITIQEGVFHIGSSAFAGTALKSLALPDSLSAIAPYAFNDCAALETVTFGNGLQTIGYRSFAESGLKAVHLPDSLRFMENETFMDCTQLEEVTLGSGVEGISNRCFRNTALKTITLPEQLAYIGDLAFVGTPLKEVIVECEGVEIYGDAFAGCPFDEIDLGDSVRYIDPGAFSGTGATQIRHPASVTEISYRVYAFNMNLVSVTIPESVEYISETAFEGDKNLSHVLFTGTEEQWYNKDYFSDELIDATVHFNADGDEVTTKQTCTTVEFYCTLCEKWETVRKGKMDHTFDSNMTCTICGYQGYWEYAVDETAHTVTITGYTGPEADVTVPDTIDGMPVTAFTEDAFAYNRKLTSVALPNGITAIPANAFGYCSSLLTVTMGSQVTTVGEKAFYYCSNLEEMELPKGVTEICASAFEGCHALVQLTLPATVTRIGEEAFLNCGSLNKLAIPAGVTEIGNSTFEGCWNMEELTIPDTVTTIGYYAFMNTSIDKLVIPASVKKIGAEAFVDSEIQNILFLGDMPTMGYVVSGDTTAFYAAGNKTWNELSEDGSKWFACAVPTITQQPVAPVVEAGETVTLFAGAYGQRLRYQWYYAAPDAKRFAPVGGNTPELSMVVDQDTARGRVYCLVTDVLGQTAKTDTITLRNPSVPNGIRIGQLPYTVEYDLRQQLRTRGLQVLLTYTDNTEEEIFDYTVTGYDANIPGKQTVTVTYGDFTATFTVTVNEEKVTFVSTVEENAPEEQIEISAPQGAVDSSVELVVEKLPEEAPPQDVPELPEVIQENAAVIFDITLEQEGAPVQPTDTVQVSIPVPEHMESKRCKVYHIDDNGAAHDMNARYVDGRMVFETEHFSYYAVVEVGGVTVSGVVTGQGDIAGTVVKLISGGEVLETVSVTENGSYRFNDVVANDYIIEAFQEGLPAKQLEVTIADQDQILDILLAILGDINGDTKVNSDDVIRLLLYVSMPSLFPIEAEADFTGEGDVTSDDVIRLLLHVSMPGMFPLA